MGTGILITAPTQVCPRLHILPTVQLTTELMDIDVVQNRKLPSPQHAAFSFIYMAKMLVGPRLRICWG